MIVSAAVKTGNGLILSLPRPARHHDIISHAGKLGLDEVITDQGFLTSDGEYVDRKLAKYLAIKSKQKLIIRNYVCEQLFSEDLW